jgi:uncharacterized delta-60 repeat protein
MNRSRDRRARAFGVSPFEPLERRQLMSAGDLDPTFGQGGKVLTAFGFAANDMAVQADGKIVLVGSLDTDFAVARLNADGTPDTTFGHGSGLATTDMGGAKTDVADKVVIQPDGKIVVGGRKMKGDRNGQFAFARYNSDGTLDNSFDENGKLTVFDRMDISPVGGLALQPDGKIVFSGAHYHTHLNFTNPGYHHDFRTARLMPNGALDKTFGTRVFTLGQTRALGYIESDFDADDIPAAVMVQPDGKIVVAGTRSGDDPSSFILARYTAIGTHDDSFDGNGELATNFGGKAGVLFDAALQPDGKIVAAGVSNGAMTLVRYNTNGSEDESFSGGRVFTNLTAGNDVARSVLMLPKGKILVVGTIGGAAVATQYLSNGLIDPSFGQNGTVTIKTGFGVPVRSAQRMVDGRVVIAGPSGGQTGVMRLLHPPAQVNLFNWRQNAAESAGAAKNGSVIVTRDAVYDFPTRVLVNVGGSAAAFSDYTSGFVMPRKANIGGAILHRFGPAPIGSPSQPGQAYIDIPAHQSFVEVPINVINDTTVEPAEEVSFTLAPSPAYTIGRNTSASVSIADDDEVHVNFQAKTDAPPPSDRREDIGRVFGDRGNGLFFGWDADNTALAVNRGNSGSPDFRFDSLNHMQRGANRKWEIAVPNGLYTVRLVAGDPSFTDAVYKMNLENTPAISGTPSGNTRWFMSTLNVQVNDGRLTLSNAAGSVNNRICFIEIKSAAPGATSGAVLLNVPIRLGDPPPPAALTLQAMPLKPISRTLFSNTALKEAILG